MEETGSAKVSVAGSRLDDREVRSKSRSGVSILHYSVKIIRMGLRSKYRVSFCIGKALTRSNTYSAVLYALR